MWKKILLLPLSILLSAPLTQGQMSVHPNHLITIEPDGSISAGSKQALRAAYRAGLPIRVGWAFDFNQDGKPELSHWADAIFLTEFEGEIFTQVTEIHRQTPLPGKAHVVLNPKMQRWTGLLGSNGILEGRFNDAEEPNQMRVKSWWHIDSRAPRSQWPAEVVSLLHSDQQQESDRSTPKWRLVYHHDAEGKPLGGSKDALLDAVRRGYPIRFAWGLSRRANGRPSSVEHLAEPVFLTIIDGNELVVQLPEHIAQASYWDVAQAKFDNPSVMWRGLMSTTGDFDAVMVDRATGKTIRRLPQQARIVWYALSPDPTFESRPAPKLAVPDGVLLKR